LDIKEELVSFLGKEKMEDEVFRGCRPRRRKSPTKDLKGGLEKEESGNPPPILKKFPRGGIEEMGRFRPPARIT